MTARPAPQRPGSAWVTADRLMRNRAFQLGVAIGAGYVWRRITERGDQRPEPGLVDWKQVERIADRRFHGAPGALSQRELQAAVPAYETAMTRIVPLLEQRLGSPLPGVVERHAVVDRAGWARANLVTFRHLVGHIEQLVLAPTQSQWRGGLDRGLCEPLRGHAADRLPPRLPRHSGPRPIRRRSAVRGSRTRAGCCSSRRTSARPRSSSAFRSTISALWIALHETTHAFEMEAHPWLRPYLQERLERQIALFLEEARTLQERGIRHLRNDGARLPRRAASAAS